jgi:hypothetical protein
MIGRAAPTNPWIFSQMQQYAATGRYSLPNDEDRHRLLSGYYQQINAAQLPDAVGKMKQFACWFTHGVGNGSELRRIVHAARTPSEVLESVERFFAQRAAAAGNEIDRPAVIHDVDRSAAAHDADRPAVKEKEATPHGPAQLAVQAEVGT